MKNSRLQISLIAALAGITTILHYVTDPHAGNVHDVYQRFYYVPVVLAGLWFGVRGGLLTAFLIAIAYFPHALHGWRGPYSLFYRLTEVGMYHIIGALTGYMSSRVRQALHEREAAYEHLRMKTEELFTLEEQLRRSDRLAALGSLSAGLAHEIRNPLASITTSLEILRGRAEIQEKECKEEEPDFYSVLLEETERLNRILENFLDFARLKEGQDAGAPAIANVYDCAVKTAELLVGRAEQQGIGIIIDEIATDCSVRIPEAHLRQTFLNLFLNSLEAMKDGGTINVSMLKSDDEHSVQILVEDSGSGIAPDIADRIFDPFYTTKDSGTGLGLAIVARILDGHGGSIKLNTEVPKGASFLVTLQKSN